MRYLILVFAILLSADATGQSGSLSIGRLFTTPEQRQQLDQIRYAVEIKPVELAIDDEIQPQTQNSENSFNPIIVKGLIYSKSGTSAAWVNEGNTLNGNIEQEYIRINIDKITGDQVPVLLMHKNEIIKLKVGESYIPEQRNNNTMTKAE